MLKVTTKLHENDPEFVSVNGLRYRTMINEFLCLELEDMDVDNVYFQPEISLLREKFSGRVISRNDNYNWPPRSCDFTPLDFFLWGYVTDKVYADAPQSIQERKAKIRADIDETQPQICKNLIENFIKRARSCKRCRGGYMNNIVFYY